MLGFHLDESRKRGSHAKTIGRAHVDAAHQRLDEPLERLAAQAARGELRQAFVGRFLPRRNEVLVRQAKLAANRQNGRGDERPEALRGHQGQARGHAAEAAPTNDIDAVALRVGAHKIAGDANAAAEIETPRDLRQEAIGTVLDAESLNSFACGSRHRCDRKTQAAGPRARGPARAADEPLPGH